MWVGAPGRGDGSAPAGSPPFAPAARRARAWYSGPCLRGSAYSFGLIVQYVPLVVPYQLAPPQSGSNGPASAPSYDVDPSVALPRPGRGVGPGPVGSRRRRVPGASWSGALRAGSRTGRRAGSRPGPCRPAAPVRAPRRVRSIRLGGRACGAPPVARRGRHPARPAARTPPGSPGTAAVRRGPRRRGDWPWPGVDRRA